MKETGVIDLMLKGSRDYDEFALNERKFIESLTDITLEYLQGTKAPPGSVTVE